MTQTSAERGVRPREKDLTMRRTQLPNGWHVVDDTDLLEIEALVDDPPAPIPFPITAPDGGTADVASVLRAADDACRLMDVLARELDCLVDEDGDDGPRAA
jgi:hypothetical protein